ncbi:VCBS repeat-containing protein [Streptomyces sp. ISL-10]|uniref:FG-GAP-like repeat-containing protein n=1 Tax=Streptomyces sp. ISL-10 TaxID=2819172 RepID=UPI001BEB7001|nr:FG-GAP-like repeat-containing protein [Streptomyces sp. ISL-10]MBT2369463.1 VCBS repeat-containing protein [Streptomyces sp. ISL-10]
MYGKRPLGGFVAAAVVLGAAVAIGPASPTAQAQPTPEVVIPGVTSEVPVHSYVVNAGPNGYLRIEEGRGAIWRSYGGVSDVEVDAEAKPWPSYEWGSGSDVVARHQEAAGTVALRDMVTGQTATVQLPTGHTYLRALGWNVLTRTGSGSETRFHVLDVQTGQLRDRLVEGLPAGNGANGAGVGDAEGLVLGWSGQYFWLDVTQQRAFPIGVDASTTVGEMALTPDRLLVRGYGKVSVFRRDDLTKPELVRPLTGDADVRLLGLVGNELIVARHDPALGVGTWDMPTWRVDAEPLDGSPTRTLLARTKDLATATPSGGLLVHGGPSTSEWGVQRIEADSTGRAVVGPDTRVATRIVPNTVNRLSFHQGRLTSLESVAAVGRTGMYTRTAEPEGGTVVHGARQDRGWLPPLPDRCSLIICPRVDETGDGRIVYGGPLGTGPSQGVLPIHRLDEGRQLPGTKFDVGTQSQGMIGSWGRWTVAYAMLSDGSPETRIVDTDTGQVVRKLPVQPRSLSGTTLWAHGQGHGTIAGYDIRTGARVKELYLSGCFVEGAESVGRWLHWICSGSRDDEGVLDLETGAVTPLGIGYGNRAKLGDGFVAYPQDGKLKVKDLRDGGTVHEIDANLNAIDAAWDIDPATNTIAWADAKGAIHLVGSGVATSALTVADSAAAASVNVKSAAWKPRWWLSEPAASWTLTLRNKATGAVVRTLSGAKARGLVSPSWDGRDTAGKLVANGAHTWTLTAKPADGQGADVNVFGTVSVTGAAPVRRDLVGDDGFGDLLVMDSTGLVSLYKGTGTGGLSSRIAGTGAKFATSAVLVPSGDVNGDRCNDVLVRLGNELRSYRPGCGKIVSASSPYTSIGTGWGQYDVLTTSGDVNADGHIDLIARQTTSGDMYFYAGTADHRFKSRVKIGTNWKTYTKVVGAGDLNGDGRGDLLGVDKAGALWRYHGTATGGVTSRVKLADAWGSAYTTVVGMGDITGDGKPDLVARDTAGKLFRFSGTGTGTLAGRVQIGTSGWAAFKGLY